jgi:1,4-alpha-glucan branching enzyme
LGVPREGTYREVLNTDAQLYGGSGVGNFGSALAEPIPSHGLPASMVVTLPPLGVVWFASPEEPVVVVAAAVLAEEPVG